MFFFSKQRTAYVTRIRDWSSDVCSSDLRSAVMATSVRLDAETEKRLDQLAEQTGRTKAYYIREMIERSIEDMEDYYLAAKVIEDIRAGRETVSSLDDVERRLGLDG